MEAHKHSKHLSTQAGKHISTQARQARKHASTSSTQAHKHANTPSTWAHQARQARDLADSIQLLPINIKFEEKAKQKWYLKTQKRYS